MKAFVPLLVLNILEPTEDSSNIFTQSYINQAVSKVRFNLNKEFPNIPLQRDWFIYLDRCNENTNPLLKIRYLMIAWAKWMNSNSA